MRENCNDRLGLDLIEKSIEKAVADVRQVVVRGGVLHGDFAILYRLTDGRLNFADDFEDKSFNQVWKAFVLLLQVLDELFNDGQVLVVEEVGREDTDDLGQPNRLFCSTFRPL